MQFETGLAIPQPKFKLGSDFDQHTCHSALHCLRKLQHARGHATASVSTCSQSTTLLQFTGVYLHASHIHVGLHACMWDGCSVHVFGSYPACNATPHSYGLWLHGHHPAACICALTRSSAPRVLPRVPHSRTWLNGTCCTRLHDPFAMRSSCTMHAAAVTHHDR